MVDYSHLDAAWYVMKTSFKRELRAKDILDRLSVESYIPMTQRDVVYGGRLRRVMQPAVHNLIFVRVDHEQLDFVKSRVNFLHNYIVREDDVLRPVIISDRDMMQFIGVTSERLNRLIYLDLSQQPLPRGCRVRITGGDFEGYEGVLMKVKGARDKRVVLHIEGVMAVAMASIDPIYIERIDG